MPAVCSSATDDGAVRSAFARESRRDGHRGAESRTICDGPAGESSKRSAVLGKLRLVFRFLLSHAGDDLFRRLGQRVRCR